MNQVRYSSFKEIDERLKILSLQREISKESIKLDLARAKSNLYPSQLLGSAKGMVQKIALTFLIKKLSNVVSAFRNRERVELME
ncbi:MAG: DUF6327 family protein [Flavobacteriaceae bacterium]